MTGGNLALRFIPLPLHILILIKIYLVYLYIFQYNSRQAKNSGSLDGGFESLEGARLSHIIASGAQKRYP